MCPSVQCLHRNPPGLEISHSCFGSRTRSRPSTCRIGSAAAALHPCPSTETRHVAALPRWRRSRNCQLLECSAGGNTNRTAKGRAWRSWDLWPKWLPGEPDILSISIIFIQKMSRIECSNILRPKPNMTHSDTLKIHRSPFLHNGASNGSERRTCSTGRRSGSAASKRGSCGATGTLYSCPAG